jgi:two-component system, NarL family, invasion response regulator UvrY
MSLVEKTLEVVRPILSVLIIDDSLLIRMGLKQLIGEEYRRTIFGEALTGAEGSVLVSKQRWDLVILDISLPDEDAFSLLQEICARHSEIQPPVLMLGMHADPLYAARALRLGASGYVAKSSTRPDLLKAIGNVLAGKKFFRQSLFRGAATGNGVLPANLSAREYEVLLALARGKQPGKIAAELNLNGRTVSTFKRRIFNKLQLNSTADLIRYVIAHKLA